MVSILTPAEILIAARRLAGTRPHLAAIAGIVHHEDLWQLCRDELTGVDIRIDGWDIRGRWFGVVVGATPRTGQLQRGQTISWRVVAPDRTARGTRLALSRWSRLTGKSTSPLLSATIVSFRGSAACRRSSVAPPRS